MIQLNDIQMVSDHCIRLLSLTESLRGNELTKDAHKHAEQLFPLLRKLYIASLMHHKKLICISGLQGVGKTTLMKNFYGINDEIMNVSLGRGERIPVLITESDVHTPEIAALVVDKDNDGRYSSTKVILQKEKFIDATKGEDPKIMYIEITVPYKHTYNNRVSFMLLPGFEKKNEYWNNLIEFSVNTSKAAVFVFNETSFSNVDNETILDRIEKKFGSNVVYAITGSDTSLDDNKQVKQTCIDVLKLKADDRVVCVGQYSNKNKNEEWISLFKSAIEKYALPETQGPETDEYIYKVLLDIQDILGSILEILNDGDSFEVVDNHNHPILKAFDEAMRNKRKVLKDQMNNEFEEAKGHSVRILADQFDAKPWYDNIKKIFFGVNVKEYYIQTQEMIKASLSENGNCLPDYYQGNAISNSIKVLESPSPKSPNQLQLLVDRDEKDGKYILIASEGTEAALNDVYALVKVPEKNADRYQLKSNTPERLVKAVAEIATYYYGLTSYEQLAEKNARLASYEPAKSTITGDDFLQGAKSSKKFAAGLAGIMGVDMLADGSLNLISQIASSCSVALPYAGVAAVLIVAAGGASVVMKDINRMQIADFNSAKMVINEIYDNIQQEALERFDVFTKQVRERIEDNLADLNRDGRRIITNYNAKVEVNILLDMLGDMTTDYLKCSHGVERCFSI